MADGRQRAQRLAQLAARGDVRMRAMRLPGSRGRKRLGPTRQDQPSFRTARPTPPAEGTMASGDSSLNASMGIAPFDQRAAFPGPSAWLAAEAAPGHLGQRFANLFRPPPGGRALQLVPRTIIYCRSYSGEKEVYRLATIKPSIKATTNHGSGASRKGSRTMVFHWPGVCPASNVSRTSRAASLIVAVVWAKVEASFADWLSVMTCPPSPNNRNGSGLFLP